MRPVINSILTDKQFEEVKKIITYETVSPLFEYVTLKPSAVSKISINTIILSVYSRFRDYALEKGLAFRYDLTLDDFEAEVMTDGRLLETILSVLIEISFAATADGYISFGYVKKGDQIEFYIADTGIRCQSSKLAEPKSEMRHKIDCNDSKTNISVISDCRSMIKLLGGKMWIKSDPWDGSVSYFSIPYII